MRILIKVKDIGRTVFILLAELLIGYILELAGLSNIHIFTIYVLGILITVLVTESNVCGYISVAGLFSFNYFFAEPVFSFRASGFGFPLTFVILLTAVFMMGTLVKKNREQVERIAVTAKRTNILLETSQMLQKAKCKEEIAEITGNRLMRILDKNIIIFQEKDGRLGDAKSYFSDRKSTWSYPISALEYETAQWAFQNRCAAGARTNYFADRKGTYMPIHTEERGYGVIGIDLCGDTYDVIVVKLVIGECALAYEREYYNQVREEAAVQAKNEKLRSDLLRSISHDLRTPLTGISGNAALLSSQDEILSHEKRVTLSESIWKDANWLIRMVENLLLITKREDLEKNVKMQPELLEEIISEAVECISKQYKEHQFRMDLSEEMFVVQCNAQLITQVLRNLLDNASKYTKEGTVITVTAKDLGDFAEICVRDQGSGIRKEEKPFIFDMFYTAGDKASDRGRGFGIGLTLCKAIVEIHGGTIRVEDAMPHGAALLFTLKKAGVS